MSSKISLYNNILKSSMLLCCLLLSSHKLSLYKQIITYTFLSLLLNDCMNYNLVISYYVFIDLRHELLSLFRVTLCNTRNTDLTLDHVVILTLFFNQATSIVDNLSAWIVYTNNIWKSFKLRNIFMKKERIFLCNFILLIPHLIPLLLYTVIPPNQQCGDSVGGGRGEGL